MKIWRINIGLMAALFCLGQANAGTSAMQDPVLVPQKAIPDSTYKEIDQSQPGNIPAPAPSIKHHNHIKSQEAPKMVLDENDYPLVGRMEVITFGQEKTDKSITERLDELEQEVFHAKFSEKSLFDRTQKLKLTILGPEGILQEGQDINSFPLLSSPHKRSSKKGEMSEITYFELMAQNPENQIAVENHELPKYALQLINNARAQLNFSPLVMDEVASKMAEEHVKDLHRRRLVSHTNEKGENPDLRYTLAGGNDALMECTVALRPEHVKKNEYTRALVAHAFRLLIERQDDREALLSPEATGFGFALRLWTEQGRAIVGVEVSTNHGSIAPIDTPIKIGDKVIAEGTINEPYKFSRITVAYEAYQIACRLPKTK